MTDMEILQLSDKCGVTAVSKHEWDGKRFNHTDDLLDGDFAGLIQFARLLIAGEREACAKLCETECAQNDGITCAEAIRERS
jgi:hypothetical protein